MTYQECLIVTAYTGVLMCDFDDYQKFIEEKLGELVWTHELADKKMQERIRDAVKPDFIALCMSKKETMKKCDKNQEWKGK